MKKQIIITVIDIDNLDMIKIAITDTLIRIGIDNYVIQEVGKDE